MPTPSSDQPSTPPSPQPHSFSTCPDDLQSVSRSGWQNIEGQALSPITRMEADAEAVVLGESADNIREDALLADVQTPADYSSRASTMSPGLRSNLTTGTSPISSGPGAESDSSKFDHLTGNDASDAHAQLCLQSNFARPVRNCPQRSALTEPASVDGGSSENSPFDDDAYAPSMGYDFPTMRVSVTTSNQVTKLANEMLRPSHSLLHLSYALEAGFMAHSNPSDKYTMFK